VFVEQDVLWLDITVYHIMLVSIVNGHSDRSKEAHDIGDRGKLPFARGITDIISQGSTLHITHHDIGGYGTPHLRRLGGREAIILHNVGMA
jgi:hypothetical protein